MQAGTFYGYRFLQKLPCLSIKVDYNHDENLNEGNIDEWFSDYLDNDPKHIPLNVSANATPVESQARFVISRALALYRDILTTAGIPCYQTGGVVRFDPAVDRPDSATVAFTLQVIDNIPLWVFGGLFREVLALVRGPMTQKTQPDAAEKVLQTFRKETIQTFSDRLPFNLSQQSILGLAARMDVPFRQIGLGIVKLGWGSKSRLLQYSRSDADSAIANDLCDDKFLTARLLRSAGLPGVEHIMVHSEDEAVDAAEKLGWPVVIKPSNRERSEGITTNITDNEELKAAYAGARQYGDRVLVERHVPGDCHRIFIANEQLIYVVRRIPKGITGDGKKSITELVEEINLKRMKMPPWRRWKPWPLDAEADRCLADQGLTRDSVPDEGQDVKLRAIQSSEWGGRIEDLSLKIHPDNVRLAIDATRLMGMSISGVDLMTTDITQPWHENGAKINEMNFTPEFNWMDREEAARNIIPALLDGNGRIPVHLLTGEGDLLAAARELKASLAAKGSKCHLTTADFSEDGEGREIPMSCTTVFERNLALALRPDVDELIVAGTQQEVLEHGFAVDRFETATVIQTDKASAKQVAALLQVHIRIGTIRLSQPGGL